MQSRSGWAVGPAGQHQPQAQYYVQQQQPHHHYQQQQQLHRTVQLEHYHQQQFPTSSFQYSVNQPLTQNQPVHHHSHHSLHPNHQTLPLPHRHTASRPRRAESPPDYYPGSYGATDNLIRTQSTQSHHHQHNNHHHQHYHGGGGSGLGAAAMAAAAVGPHTGCPVHSPFRYWLDEHGVPGPSYQSYFPAPVHVRGLTNLQSRHHHPVVNARMGPGQDEQQLLPPPRPISRALHRRNTQPVRKWVRLNKVASQECPFVPP